MILLCGNHTAIDFQCLIKRQRQLRLVGAEQGRQAPGDAHISARHVPRLFGKVDAALLQFFEQFADTLALQPFGRRRIGIDGDDPRTCIDEIGMQVSHKIRLVDQHAGGPERCRRRAGAAQQFLPHAAVGQNDPLHARILSFFGSHNGSSACTVALKRSP